MKLSEFDYYLPVELIAQTPVKPRDHSRLLVLDKDSGAVDHRLFINIEDYLSDKDVLVFNDSRVFPARLVGRRQSTGGKLEIFLLQKKDSSGIWQCLVGGRRARVGLNADFDKGLKAELLENLGDGTWNVQFNKKGKAMMDIVEKIGLTPLPPYIKRDQKKSEDENLYQTVYANEEKTGSVAAPTAGFHFTPELLDRLKKKGVQLEYVTLHVGLGTFAPVKEERIEKHKIHSEFVEVDKETVKRLQDAIKQGKRIVAVGTTTTRTLEALADEIQNSKSTRPAGEFKIQNLSRWVDIFIYPGYKFKIVDAMITNFHLPKSTLLMLVSAFVGKEKIKNTYQIAIDDEYRFYSYGDAMFIK